MKKGDRLSPLRVRILSVRDIGVIGDHTLLAREQSLGQARRFAGAGRAEDRDVSPRQPFEGAFELLDCCLDRDVPQVVYLELVGMPQFREMPPPQAPQQL